VTMRDDRYRGTNLPSQVRKLFRMAEREADQSFPDRSRNQAIAAQESDARTEISPRFCERLRQHNSNPDLFDGTGLVEAAGSSLEVDIARTIEGDPRIRSADALPGNPDLTAARLRRLVQQHRREWDEFVNALPPQSWAREIVDHYDDLHP
jgi:hypothetical protein